MKRIGLYGSIVVIILVGLATYLLMPAPARPPATLTPEAALYPTATPQPTHTPVPPTPVFYDEYTIVILGQDETVERCRLGERCGETAHSDVFVIVHVTMSPTPKAVVVLVPRNLYVPNVGFEMWSMAVYGRTGMDGLHTYVNAVFGLPVQAVFVTKMDRFTQIVDAFGGLTLRDKTMTGEEVLAFLRDNENNWGCATYDCEGRIFEVAAALREQAASAVVFGLLETTLFNIHPLYETDLGAGQVVALLTEYFAFEVRGGSVEFVRLWSPEVERNDTPLEVRGMVPTVRLYDWMAEVLR